GQRIVDELCTAVTSLQNMTKVLRQAIRNIQRSMRDASQLLRETPGWQRPLKGIPRSGEQGRIRWQLILQEAQGNIGGAKRTRDPFVVTPPSRISTHGMLRLDLTHDGYANDNTRGTSCGITPD